jgi:hypothetical protein
MTTLIALAERVEGRSKPDRDLDYEVAEALGGQVRRVSRIGLSGRSPGSWRVFWPPSNAHGVGSAIPYYTRTDASRTRAASRLRALSKDTER